MGATDTGTEGDRAELVLRGGNQALWECKDAEILVEGAAGTGKTRSILEYLWWVSEEFPGARILLTRLERTRITRSVLVTFERDVVDWSQITNRKVTREQRHSYRRSNGSEFIVQGAEDIQALLSQEYDVAYWNEITECPTHEPFEALHRALRSGPVPWRQLIADCNPNRPTHWILKRCERGITTRIKTVLKDNPRYYNADGNPKPEGAEYLGRLSSKMTGVQYKRLVLGEWCAAEGLVLPLYAENEETFRCPAPPKLTDAHGRDRYDWRRLGDGIRFWWGAIDWGTRAPGCLQVWGKDGEGRIFRVAEVYQTGRDVNWWARVACELATEFHEPARPFRAFVADSAGADQIMVFNAALIAAGHTNIACTGWQKDYEAQVDLLRAGFNPKDPRIFLMQNATRYGRDTSLDDVGAPCSTEEELLLLTYPDHIDKPSRAKDERADPLCADHGFDAMRGSVDYGWRLEAPVRLGPPKYEPGSAGAILKHEEKWRKSMNRGAVKPRWGIRG